MSVVGVQMNNVSIVGSLLFAAFSLISYFNLLVSLDESDSELSKTLAVFGVVILVVSGGLLFVGGFVE